MRCGNSWGCLSLRVCAHGIRKRPRPARSIRWRLAFGGFGCPARLASAKALRRCLQGGFRSVECSLRVPAEVSISNSELCALVSNMLDNALNACEDVDPGKRFVVFKASVKGSYLVLDMRNSKSTSEGDEEFSTESGSPRSRRAVVPSPSTVGDCPSSTRLCSATTGRFPLSVPRPGSACR